ncbi:MAG TPA: TIR domain-containing protein [Sphingomicrobium sp.]|nr:TIR domain-containing protein [Sphingomicrobium sp.]
MFLSYASADRAVAERLANAIADTGLTVWWDRHIKGGAEFSRDIERQLEAARHVLVLWSKEAVDSRWVRDEASVAADSGRLVGASLDGTPPPLGFRQFQTVDLKAWATRGAAIPAALAEALEVEASEQPSPARSAPRRRWIAAGIAASVIAVAGTVAIVQPPPFDRLLSGEAESETLSLAIMPFVTQDGAGIDYLGAGLSSALADSLASLSGLKITASTSTHAIAGKGLTTPDIADKLGVSHLVEGNVQKSGDRLSISMRLIDARTSDQVWTRTFDGSANELQLVKSRMARELAGALSARLGAGQGVIAERRNVDPRAYEAYLRALERVSVRDAENSRQEALKQFRLAASIDPGFADAHAGYAYLMALSMPDQVGMAWPELMSEQRRAADRALKIDPENDLALVATAVALQNFDGEVERSISIDEAVLKRSPNFGPAHYSMATGLHMAGRSRDALDQLDQAIDRDPFDDLLRFYRAAILNSMGDYDGVRAAVTDCVDPCGGITFEWFSALIGFGTPELYHNDFPKFAERVRAGGISEEDLAEVRGIAESFILGRPFALSRLDDGVSMDFAAAAIAARMISFDEGLRYAFVAANDQQPDTVADILNGGRMTFTPEQRADPRYHQLFRHPRLVKIAAARRKNGVTAGLPVYPVKPYTGR